MARVIFEGWLAAVVAAIPDVPAYLMNEDTAPLGIALFANDIIPNPSQPATQFTAPTFTGYAAKTFPAVGVVPDIFLDPTTGAWCIKIGTGYFFQPTGGWTGDEMIYGYWVGIAGATSTYLWADRFDEPVQLLSTADAVSIDPLVLIPLNAIQ